MFGFSAAQLLALGLAMTSALASPMPQDPAAAAPQLRVFYCKSIEFDGECATQKIGLHKCENVKQGFGNQISSIKNLDTDINDCTWYLKPNCERGPSYTNRDDANLSDGNGQFDDSISSIRC